MADSHHRSETLHGLNVVVTEYAAISERLLCCRMAREEMVNARMLGGAAVGMLTLLDNIPSGLSYGGLF